MMRVSFIFLMTILAGCAAKSDLQEAAQSSIHIASGELADHNGKPIRLYGVNSVHVWLNESDARRALEHEYAQQSINSVRLVTAAEAWTWNRQSETTEKKEQLIRSALAAGLLPILELHDATCVNEIDRPAAEGKMGLKQVVNHWLKPENINLLARYKSCLILNIANEWGPSHEGKNASDYFIGYKDAILRIRNAGVTNVIMIDAGGCGQDPYTLLNHADSLTQIDPLHNVIASIHLYGMWKTNDKSFSDWTPPYSVEELIPRLAALKTPVIIGEFGWSGEGSSVSYSPEILLQTALDHNMGWLFWAWYSNHGETFFNLTTDSTLSIKSPADWSEAGRVLLDSNSAFSFRRVAQPIDLDCKR